MYFTQLNGNLGEISPNLVKIKNFKIMYGVANAWYAPNYGNGTVDISAAGFINPPSVALTVSGFASQSARTYLPAVTLGAVTNTSFNFNTYAAAEAEASFHWIAVGI